MLHPDSGRPASTRRPRHRWLWRYFLTTTLLVLVPCALLSATSHQVYASIIRSQILERSMLHLEKICNELDIWLETMEATAYQLSENTLLAAKRVENDPLQRPAAIKGVANAIATNRTILDVLIYYPGVESILTSSTWLHHWQIPVLLKLQQDMRLLLDRQNLVAHASSILMLDNCYLYIPSRQTSQIYPIFLLSGNSLEKLWEGTVGVGAIVDNHSGEPIFFSQGSQSFFEQTLKLLPLDQQQPYSLISMEGEEWVLTSSQTRAGRYTLLHAENASRVLEPLTRASTLFAILTTAVLGTVAILIGVSGRASYRPILRLTKGVRDLVGERSTGGYDELDGAMQGLYYLAELNSRLEREAQGSQAFLMGYLLRDLLGGKIQTLAELNRNAAALGKTIQGSHYLLLLVSFTGEIRPEALQQLEEQIPPDWNWLGYAMSNDRQLYFLATTPQQLAEPTLAFLEPLRIEGVLMAASGAFDSLPQASCALEQALYALSCPDNNGTRFVQYNKPLVAPTPSHSLSEPVGDPFMTQILGFITQHFSDSDFSVQMVSDEFRIPVSSLSNLFKKRMGYTLMDAITFLKIEKAKKLLRTTDCTLQQLVVEIGYSDVSSFVRKFKKSMGVTPGYYRSIGGNS